MKLKRPVSRTSYHQLALAVRDELVRMGRWNSGGMLPAHEHPNRRHTQRAPEADALQAEPRQTGPSALVEFSVRMVDALERLQAHRSSRGTGRSSEQAQPPL